MVVLVATCLSRLGLCCLGDWRVQLLHHWRAGVELADRRRPRQVLDHFNLYCKCPPRPRQPTSPAREEMEGEEEEERGRQMQEGRRPEGDERRQRAQEKREEKRKSE